MKLLWCAISGIAGSAGSLSDDLFDDGLSLLQLRHSSNSSSSPSEGDPNGVSHRASRWINGVPFGCTGRKKFKDHMWCSVWGDVHMAHSFRGGGPDFDGTGWFWLAKSKDGAFQAQHFMKQAPSSAHGGAEKTAITHFAFKFGDHKVFVDRDLQDGKWGFTYYFDGELKSSADSPMDLGDLYWKTAHSSAAGMGARATLDRTSCFEYGDAAMYVGWSPWLESKETPYSDWAMADILGTKEYLDPMFGQCGLNGGPWDPRRGGGGPPQRVKPEDLLITTPQHDKVCKDNKLSDEECDSTAPPPPPKTKEQLCEENGVEISFAEELCADQEDHGKAIYDGCVFDVCAVSDQASQLNAVAGAEAESNTVHPDVDCLVAGDACNACSFCARSTAVDLSNVVQNNLGGLGPDTGAEEVRFKNAIELDGKMLDVVLTAEGEYRSKKPGKNGYADGGFGRFTIQPKSSTDFKFTFVDPTTGDPVSVPSLALTFYDLDQGKSAKQQEKITVCGAKEVYSTSDTELDHQKAGVCHSLSSTTRGTGKDNPTNAKDITKMQAARSGTFEFHSRGSISFSAGVLKSGRAPRQVLFSFEPAVACGTFDGENHCAESSD